VARTSAAPAGTPLPAGRGWRSTRTALHLRPDLPFETWRGLGGRVAAVADSSSWWIGDWLLFGERAYGSRYRDAIDATGLEYQTLRNYAWIASRFAVSRRRDTLTFGHHAEVAALDEDDQETWLRRAAMDGWSRNELRRRLHAARGDAPAVSRPPAIQLAIAPQRLARWEAAAAAQGRPLDQWIAAVVDAAASSVLEQSLTAA
jgi:hypothetical protein